MIFKNLNRKFKANIKHPREYIHSIGGSNYRAVWLPDKVERRGTGTTCATPKLWIVRRNRQECPGCDQPRDTRRQMESAGRRLVRAADGRRWRCSVGPCAAERPSTAKRATARATRTRGIPSACSVPVSIFHSWQWSTRQGKTVQQCPSQPFGSLPGFEHYVTHSLYYRSVTEMS